MSGVGEKVPLWLSHGADSPMVSVIASARRLGAAGGNALVCGEAGTGKEALARLIHEAANPAAPFLVLRCGGRDQREVALELFGAAGPSPGQRGGMLAEASGGTLFLEEVAELSAELQARLVHDLAADGGLETAGDPRTPRLVASSARDLLPLVTGGAFQRELYDALSTTLRLTSLRERRGDILAIVDRAWSSLGSQRVLGDGARALIRQYAWPGNAPEIVGFVRRLVTNSVAPVITVRDVERELFMMTTGLSCWGPADDPSAVVASSEAEPRATAVRRVLAEAGQPFAEDDRVDLPSLMHGVEAALIDWALQRTAGNRSGAAQLLGIRRTTLVEKLRRRRGLPDHAGLDPELRLPTEDGCTEVESCPRDR
jgi:sigma-54 specific flagellar transcriptional regulator A